MNITTITGPAIDETKSEQRNIEDPTQPITAGMLANILNGGNGISGPAVTPHTSLRVSAVRACVWALSTAIARMPLILYKRSDQGRVRDTGNPLYSRLRMRPNGDMSAMSFFRTLMTNVLLWGNAYAEIVRNGRGDVVALVPIESQRVRPYRSGGELMYEVYTNGGAITLLKRDIIHVPGMTFDGVVGISVISHARSTIAASLSADQYSQTFLANGLRPSGVLQHPGKLGKEGLNNLRDSLQLMYGGPSNAGKPLILEEGMTWSSNAIPPEDAQFVEMGYFRIEEICRWYNVPPHKIQHLLRATNNNIEQQSLDWLSESLAPWCEAFQQEINYKLFGDQIDEVYCEFLTQALISMDATARGNFYGKLFGIGAISPDEIRARENLNDVPESRGKGYYVPSNMMPAPTPEESKKLLDSYTKKAGTGGPGQPKPETDDKVAKAD